MPPVISAIRFMVFRLSNRCDVHATSQLAPLSHVRMSAA
jgi:hypothetical protein